MRALELGAIDFVAKPANGVDLDMESVRDELLRKVKLAAKVRVVRNASRRPAMTASSSDDDSAETRSAEMRSASAVLHPCRLSRCRAMGCQETCRKR